MRTFRFVLLSLVVFTSLPGTSPALPTGNWTALESGDPIGQQGRSVDISGNLAIVGAPGFPGGGAFIYDLISGDLVHKLIASDAGPNDLFGFSVAIDGDLAIVASGQRNAAYVFDTTTGQQLRKLTPTNIGSDFIRSVDISDGVAVLGTPSVRFARSSSSTVTFDYGAAFLYNAKSGAQIRRIDGPQTFSKRGFGSDVAIEGNTVAVTSPSSFDRHDIFAFDSQTGNPLWHHGYSTTGNAFFTKDVVIDGDLLVVGGGSGSLFDIPRAYVFNRLTGDLLREFDTQVVNEGDDYRNQIDLSGDRLVIGAWGTYYDETGYYTGAVHSFDVNNGSFLGTILNPIPANLDDFGFSVALENDKLIIGSPGTGDRGAAYYYSLVPEPTALTLLCLGSICLLRRRQS